jgi:zinc protease
MLFALILFLQIASQQPAPDPEAIEIVGPYTFREDEGQTTKVILKNGLTVIVREQQAVPLTSIATFVKAGYFDEDDRISGISHVIEHMFFKGTVNRPVGQVARETQGLGGYLNAYTHYDRTVYYTVVPSENAVRALEIQADALRRSTFDADELKREIEVVLQENNRKLDNPPAVAAEKLFAAAFRQHRMKRWRIGTVEGLRALTRDDLVAYVEKYYRPSNIILSIAGQMDREKMLEEVVRLYGDMEDTDSPLERDLSPEEPAQDSLRYAWERGPVEQNYIAMGYHVPGFLDEDARILEVLAAILSDGRASRLNQFVRDEKGLITRGAASVQAFRDFGFFKIDFESNRTSEAQTAVLAELENIKRYGVSRESVERAKALIAQNHYHELETVNGVSEEMAFYEAFGDWKLAEEHLEAMQAVTPEAIVNAARKYFVSENLSVFEYLPMTSEGNRSEADFQTAVLNRVPAAMEQRSIDELPVIAEIPSAAGVFQDLVRPIQRRSVLRGPDAYILEDHRLPLVSFGIFYPGGRLLETEANAGITELMLRSAIRGSRRFNSDGIARRLENSGAQIRVVNEPDFFGYVLDGLSGKTEQALEVLMDVLQAPAFLEEEVEGEKALQAARIKRLREDNYAYPVQLFMRTLFGGHGYAQPAVGTEDALNSLTRDDLSEWHKENQRSLVPLILIVGDTQGTGLIASIADTLTNEDLQERDIESLPAPPSARENRETVETVARRQTALVYGFPGTHRASIDRYPMIVLENIVSGLGGRFFDAIREKQGLAYTVQTANTFYSKGGAIYTYTAFSPENEARVKASLEAEIVRLRDQGVTPEEVQKAIAYSIGVKEIALQTRGAQVLEYARAVFSGAGVQSVANYSQLIRNVSPELVRGVASVYLDPQAMRVAIVRGEER